METYIAILIGNRIHHFPHSTRSPLHLEDYSLVAINNFSNFGVDRTVSYSRPGVGQVATSLKRTFFPGTKLETAPRLADNIEVKVVLGHDLGPQKLAEAQQAHAPRP
jgi:hypothetical protein